jgi:phosphopantothenoylcysteine decarboxylase/phosphopantothenate--cysteine ligase
MPRAPKARGRRVVLGVSGSIAAYKACSIVRLLVKAGCEVRVTMTANAARFVAPLTLSALSRGPVVQDLMDPAHWEMAHLSLASWADRVLVAPATADLIARLVVGRACGPVEATVLSTKARVFVAPAMDTEMWEHKATQDNAKRLTSFGYTLLGPVSGPLASGRVGMGRLMDPEEIVRRTLA